MEDFDDQIFNGEDREFSSFTYRIAAIRNLGRMMRLPNSGFPSDENVDRIESHISNWRIHLPASKRNCLTEDCKLDEMMFQAHMIIHAYVHLFFALLIRAAPPLPPFFFLFFLSPSPPFSFLGKKEECLPRTLFSD